MRKLFILLAVTLLSFNTSCAQKQTKAATPQATTTKAKKLPDGVKLESIAGLTSKAEDIYNAIKAPYKGKVVLIDFWATWCPPCMNAMKSIDPIKEKYLKDKKDVAFVYVTGETSPLDKFNAAIPAIKGYHYRLTNDQFQTLLKHLGIRGIPSYVILNKDGSEAYNNIAEGGYPGDEIITSEINKALNK